MLVTPDVVTVVVTPQVVSKVLVISVVIVETLDPDADPD